MSSITHNSIETEEIIKALRAELAAVTKERDRFKSKLNDALGCETCPGLPDLTNPNVS